jgi:hypothetical protein
MVNRPTSSDSEERYIVVNLIALLYMLSAAEVGDTARLRLTVAFRMGVTGECTERVDLWVIFT